MSKQRYEIKIGPAAKRDFKKLTRNVQKELKPLIESLANDPRPAGVEPFKGVKGGYRLRHRSYRVVYQVIDSRIEILVIRIGDRKEIYDMVKRVVDLRT